MEREQSSGQFVFGLDIGTRSIVGTVGYKTSTNRFIVEAMAMKEHETRTMLDGQIHDIGKVSESIRIIKKELEEKTNRKLTEVCIAAAGRVLKTVQCRADHTFATETVINREHVYSLDMFGVEKAYEKMRDATQKDVVQYYHVGYSVIRYYLNDYIMLILEGHKANKISVELIATFLPDEVVDGLYAAVEAADLKVASLTLEPIAAINLAIPEHFRMLNLALVDVGAGTSDISIAKDGSVVAFGMMPFAGDEITEAIARHYLTDFQTAEKIKKNVFSRKTVTFKDVIGISHKVAAEEVLASTEETVRGITKDLAAKIKELNGGKTVSAVFVVGGGGKLKGFLEELSKCLELPKERVAIRGKEVLTEVDFQQKIKKDPILVTPIGICLNYYEQKNNFIYVTVNKERVKLYDNGKLSIMDAVMQLGLPNDYLFPKRGETIHFTVNGKKRMIRGEQGEMAVIKRNGKTASLSTPIDANDQITIQESTMGEMAKKEVRSLAEYREDISFTVNDRKITCPKYVLVNGELVSGYYEIKNGDKIEFINYYTVERILEFMDVKRVEEVYVNHRLADLQERVYEDFSVTFDLVEEEPEGQELDERVQEPDEQVQEPERMGLVEHESKDLVMTNGMFVVNVNGTDVALRGKDTYILVDVLDFYPFDTGLAASKRLIMNVNGKAADFRTPIYHGDSVGLHWEE